jgi:hypothetical protein
MGHLPTRHPPRIPPDLQHRLTTIINDLTEPEKQNILQLLEKSLKNEKRQRHRRHQCIKTELSGNSYSGNGIIKNISPCGAFLTTHHFHPPGSEITLCFSILNFEFPVKMKAEVIWSSSKGMGLKFKSSQKLDHRLAAQKLADALGTITSES